MRRSLTAALASVAAATAPSCTLAVGDTPVACASDSDCEARGPDFVGTGCALFGPEKNTCVPTATTTSACSTNADCVGQTGPGSVCTTDEARVRCVPLLGLDCRKTFGNPFIEGTAVIAVFGDFGGGGGRPGRDRGIFDAATQALGEIRQSPAFSLRGGRSIALIGCEQGTPTATTARLAAAGVKAIVGPTDDRAFRRVAEQAAVAGIPVVASNAFDDFAAAAPNVAGTVFRAGPTRNASIGAVDATLGAVEAAVRNERGVTRLRVAAVFDIEHREFRDAVGQLLRFNGKSAIENAADAACNNCFATFDVSDAAGIAAFRPDVVLPWVTYGAGNALAPVEKSGTSPVYIAPLDTDTATDFGRTLSVGPTQSKRFIGVRPMRADADVAAFFARRPSALGSAASDLDLRTYDATYLAAYAIVAADAQRADAPLRAQMVRNAWPRVTSGDGASVGAGPLAIGDGMAALVRGAPIRLRGIISNFQFLPSGSAVTTWERVCLSGTGTMVRNGASWLDSSSPTFSDLCP